LANSLGKPPREKILLASLNHAAQNTEKYLQYYNHAASLNVAWKTS